MQKREKSIEGMQQILESISGHGGDSEPALTQLRKYTAADGDKRRKLVPKEN